MSKEEGVYVTIPANTWSSKIHAKYNKFYEHEAKLIIDMGLDPSEYNIKYTVSGMIDRWGKPPVFLSSKIDGYELYLEKK